MSTMRDKNYVARFRKKIDHQARIGPRVRLLL